MRAIDVSTAVFAKIWSHRKEGEETENAILERLLDASDVDHRSTSVFRINPAPTGKVLWRHDVRTALRNLGGEADLKDIYEAVRDIRRKAGRSLPVSTDAIVRRELETNCEQSDSYTGQYNWFYPARGIGNGRWALIGEDA